MKLYASCTTKIESFGHTTLFKPDMFVNIIGANIFSYKFVAMK